MVEETHLQSQERVREPTLGQSLESGPAVYSRNGGFGGCFGRTDILGFGRRLSFGWGGVVTMTLAAIALCLAAAPSPPAGPPPPPSQPCPAQLPGCHHVTSAVELRAALASPPQGTLYLPDSTHLMLGGDPLYVTSNVNISSDGGGATLDAQSMSRVFNVSEGARLELQGVHLRNGLAWGGAGVMVDGGSLLMNGCSVSNCSASGGPSPPVLYGVTYYPTTLNLGGAIMVWLLGGQVELYASAFTDCSARQDESGVAALAAGGAIYLYNGSVTATGCTVTDCFITSNGVAEGGAVAAPNGDVVFSDCVVTRCYNFANGYYASGGALFVNTGSATLTNSTISDCFAECAGNVANCRTDCQMRSRANALEASGLAHRTRRRQGMSAV